MFRSSEHGERAHRFADGELSAADAIAFEGHVAECVECQQELETALLLRGRLRDLPALPPARRPSPWRRTLTVAMSAGGLVAAIAGLLLVVRSSQEMPVSPVLVQAFDELAPGRRRPVLERLAYEPAARYRPPPAVMRAARSAAAVPIAALTAVRDRGDLHGELALWLWAGDSDQARAVALRVGGHAGIDNDLAVLAMRRSQLDEAKARLDRILEADPTDTAALWNRALLFERRDDRTAAIRDYEAVATRQESGWSEEARERAARLRVAGTRPDAR
jgi:tetratricopeptide (TPR) repeat protein